MNDKAMFVKIDKYDEIQELIKTIRQKTNDAKEKVQKIRDLNKEEYQKLAEFDQATEHINANLDQIYNFMKQ
jgi:methyl-accepting chemotaxis protein